MTKFEMKLDGLSLSFEGEASIDHLRGIVPSFLLDRSVLETAGRAEVQLTPVSRDAPERSLADAFSPPAESDDVPDLRPKAKPKPKNTAKTQGKKSIDYDAIVEELFSGLEQLHTAGKLTASQVMKLRGFGGFTTAEEIKRRYLERIKSKPLPANSAGVPIGPGSSRVDHLLKPGEIDKLHALSVAGDLTLTTCMSRFNIDIAQAKDLIARYRKLHD